MNLSRGAISLHRPATPGRCKGPPPCSRSFIWTDCLVQTPISAVALRLRKKFTHAFAPHRASHGSRESNLSMPDIARSDTDRSGTCPEVVARRSGESAEVHVDFPGCCLGCTWLEGLLRVWTSTVDGDLRFVNSSFQLPMRPRRAHTARAVGKDSSASCELKLVLRFPLANRRPPL